MIKKGRTKDKRKLNNETNGGRIKRIRKRKNER